MASYQFITPTKVKLYAEFGYRDDGTRARKTKNVTIKTPNSERAAQRALEAFIAEVSKQQEPVKKITFKHFVDNWERGHVNKLHVGTIDNYEKCLRNGIMDYFGERKLAAIKPLHIMRFFQEEEAKGHGMPSQKYVTLCSIFSHALKWEVIKSNPMDRVDKKDLPKAKKRDWERKWYNANELAHMLKTLDNAKGMLKKTKIEFKLAALVGLRVSEIVGLRNEAIDFKHNTILIDRQLVWNKKEKHFMLGPTKSSKPRTVFVSDKFMQGEFKDYVTKHNKVRTQCENAWYEFIDPDFSPNPINLIFTDAHGKPTHPNNLSHRWNDFVKAHELPTLNFHGLRHSCLSYQLNKGAILTDVQRQAGHSSPEITAGVYGHSEDSGLRASANLFNDLL
jgi:integrase